MKPNVNSIDVANHAGVSQSAVSRVFTPGAPVSAAMRDKVMRSAASLGYHPNRLAGSLITHRSKLIGVVIGYLGNCFYPLAVERLCRRLRLAGYHTMMFFTEPGELADATVEAFLQYRVDGVILASVMICDTWVAACDQAGVPVVLFNRFWKDPRLAAITVDNEQGAGTVAEFLVAGGHRRIAYIAGMVGTAAQDEREAAFRKRLVELGVPLFDRAVGLFEADPARGAARELFDRPAEERPDAVFACNDQMALALMDVVRHEFDLRVPEDVSVIGFDDVPQAAWPSYKLTTVHQSVDRMVDGTIALLFERIEQPEREPRRVVMPVSLSVRESARVPEGYGAERLSASDALI